MARVMSNVQIAGSGDQDTAREKRLEEEIRLFIFFTRKSLSHYIEVKVKQV
jgi:hypothetical protein